jgi:hypothetical protein
MAPAPAEPPKAPLRSLEEFEGQYGTGTDLIYADGTRTPNFMWHAARAFFANGGVRLWVFHLPPIDHRLPAAADYATALDQLAAVRDVAVVAAPGSTFGYERGRRREADAIVRALVAHAERLRYRLAVIDSGDGQSTAQVRSMRAAIDSANAAIYYPWVRAIDPSTGAEIGLPPSGFVAGIYARVDASRGVHKAPANESVTLATGLEREIAPAEQDALNRDGINGLRRFPGRGVLVWGDRTVSSDSDWKYVNVRRLMLFLEDSIDRGLQWAVFEPNGEALWSSVRRTVADFLYTIWQDGGMLGSRPDEAFFVKCDPSTMTQEDIDNGRLVCEVGVATIKPAEFVIFRIRVATRA